MSGKVDPILSPQASTLAALSAANGGKAPPELTFSDLLDGINPFSHDSLIMQAYNKVTGQPQPESPHDQNTAENKGQIGFGGPLGLVAALADIIIHNKTGDKPSGTATGAMASQGSGNAPLPLLPATAVAAQAPASVVASAPASAASPSASLVTNAPSAATASSQSLFASSASLRPQAAAPQGQTPATVAAQLASMGVPVPQAMAAPSGNTSAASAAAAYGQTAQNSGSLTPPASGASPVAVVGATAPVAPMGTRWFAPPQRVANDSVAARPTAGTALPSSIQQLQQIRPTPDGALAQTAPASTPPLSALANPNAPLPPAPVLLGRNGQPVPFDTPAPSSATAAPLAAIESVPTTSVVPSQASAASAQPSPSAVRAALAMQGLTLKAPGDTGAAGATAAALSQALGTDTPPAQVSAQVSGIADPNGLPSWADAALQKANQAYRRTGSYSGATGGNATASAALPPS